MTAFILAFVLCADPVTLSLDWGGDLDLSGYDAGVPRTDATADSGSTASETAVPESVFETSPGSDVPPTTPVVASEPNTSCQCGGDPSKCSCTDCRCTVRCAIASYRKSGGQRAYVRGMTDYQHLTRDHGWSADQLRGLTGDELQFLHGASHAGELLPASFATAVPAKPTIRIISPATWDCPHCGPHRQQDWSDFSVTYERRDGLDSYPCTEWKDKHGVTRRLCGKYSPRQVMWSFRETVK